MQFSPSRLSFLLAVGALAGSAQAQLLIDDFTTGPYDYATSPYDPYYNGLTHSRFYFQSGSDILGSNRMAVAVSNPDFPTNDQFVGSIGGGLAVAQNTPGNDVSWQYCYGVSQAPGGPGSFPWQFANLNANLSAYDMIQLSFASSSGNLDLYVGINSPTSYFPTFEFSVPNSSTPFVYDVPLSEWAGTADLTDVNQLDFSFQTDAGDGADVTRIEALNPSPTPEPITIGIGITGLAIAARRRHRRRGV